MLARKLIIHTHTLTHSLTHWTQTIHTTNASCLPLIRAQVSGRQDALDMRWSASAGYCLTAGNDQHLFILSVILESYIDRDTHDSDEVWETGRQNVLVQGILSF